MANPRRPGGTGGNRADPTEIPPVDPPDFERIRHVQMLNEAQLVSFNGTPDTVQPFARGTLEWEVKMPTTVIPGVQVELYLQWIGERAVPPKHSTVFEIEPHTGSKFTLYLKTPLAARHLATFEFKVDLESLENLDIARDTFVDLVKSYAPRALGAVPGLSFRGEGVGVELHDVGSFVIRGALEHPINNWPNVDVDVEFQFDVPSAEGEFRVKHKSVVTKVSPGVLTTIATLGCSEAVASAIESVASTFLARHEGPEIARLVKAGVDEHIAHGLDRLWRSSGQQTRYRIWNVNVHSFGWTIVAGPLPPDPQPPDRPDRPIPVPL